DDESVKKYYDDNKSKFTKPVMYRVSHIHTTIISPEGKPEDEASRKKAARLTKMIDEDARTKINSLLKKVQAGEDFSDLAKRYSEDEASKESGGKLGELHPGSTIPEISEVMTKL
ncbi:MAG: hypothetical protein F3745_04285, partial [Nitrospinae bacterium]|nr:hypothetical protein [Nitrospinota bacterium]